MTLIQFSIRKNHILTLCTLGINFFYDFLLSDDLFPKISFFKNTFRVSISLHPDQARYFVGPDLDPNCLDGLSAEDTNGQGVKALTEIVKM